MSTQKPVILFIPARYSAQRFPGKLLYRLDDKSILHHVWDAATQTNQADQCWLVVDGDELEAEAKSISASYIRSEGDYRCGTDRCIGALPNIDSYSYLINVQADQPFLKPWVIDRLISFIQDHPDALVASVMTEKQCVDPAHNVVKVAVDDQGWARGFYRELEKEEVYYRHIGLYAFSHIAIQQIRRMMPSKNELKLDLEQLRWMDNGLRIKMLSVNYDPVSIDVPTDVTRLNMKYGN